MVKSYKKLVPYVLRYLEDRVERLDGQIETW